MSHRTLVRESLLPKQPQSRHHEVLPRHVPSGKPVVDAAAGSGPPRPSWVREEAGGAWSLLGANFPSLIQSAELQDGALWGAWAAGSDDGASVEASSSLLPARVAGKVTPFQALLLVKAFRPDRLQSAMAAWVCSALRIKALAPPALSLRQLIEAEGTASQPMLLLTTPGADPSAELADYAASAVGRERFHEIAMGQGQAEKALALLRECARSGEWLVLKNLHLAVSWLPVLEKEVRPRRCAVAEALLRRAGSVGRHSVLSVSRSARRCTTCKSRRTSASSSPARRTASSPPRCSRPRSRCP